MFWPGEGMLWKNVLLPIQHVSRIWSGQTIHSWSLAPVPSACRRHFFGTIGDEGAKS